MERFDVSFLRELCVSLSTGKSLHFWPDGHCSFEDKFDAAAFTGVAVQRDFIGGTCGGCACGGTGVGEPVRGGDRLAGQGDGGADGVAAFVAAGAARCVVQSGRRDEQAAGVVHGGAGGRVEVGSEESQGDVVNESAPVPAEQERGKHHRRNKARRERAKANRAGGAGADGRQSEIPEWRRKAQGTVKTPSLSASVCTVDTRTAEEIEAARTLALRRTAENRVAVAVAQHRLMSLKNKEKTDALMRLQVAKIEEQVNTTRAKSQASYKKCGSPIESVGSAMSAGEFGWKQELRKRKALQTKLEYIEAQNMELCKYASAEGLRIVSQMPEPYIPTDEEIEAEDEDISPYPSMEEMRAHAAAMCGDDYPW